MTDQSHLTEWGRQLKSPDETVRAEAERRITAAFSKQLLSQIKKKLSPRITRRTGEEDVLQSALRSFFAGDPSFANRTAMFAYLAKIAVNKTLNANRYHHRQIRDVRKETGVADDEQVASGKRLPRKEKTRRSYQPQQLSPLSQNEPRPFGSETLEQMTLCIPSEVAAIFIDLCALFEDFDVSEKNCLRAIVCHALAGCGHAEIAKKLKKSRRTIQRKMALIEGLCNQSKPVFVEIKEKQAQPLRAVLVIPHTTAATLLKRLKLPDHCLTHEGPGKPIRSFAPGDELFGLIDEGDVLLASPP